MADETQTEDVVGKYKRLLNMARSSLEANQASLAQKDKQITQLIAALEEERSNRSNRKHGKDDETSLIPRNLLRRVDVDHIIWVLVEYEGSDDTWVCFNKEQELDDFIQRVAGVPLIKPQRCLTAAESSLIESEAKKRVDKVVEEFRRYKVRSEISKKQRDVDLKQQGQAGPGPNTAFAPLSDAGTPTSRQSSEGDVLDGSADDFSSPRSRNGDVDGASKWRVAYEKVVRDNELLRTRGGDTLLVNQWRERYEVCMREKEDLVEKLKVYARVVESNTNGISSGKPLEQMYVDLRDEYKEFRRRVASLEKQRSAEVDDLRAQLALTSPQSPGMGIGPLSDKLSGLDPFALSLSSHYGGGSNGNGTEAGRKMGLSESKMQYIRHMVFQYLSCKDPVVRPHIESAVMAIFRFNEAERELIEERHKEETSDTILSLTGFLGSLGT